MLKFICKSTNLLNNIQKLTKETILTVISFLGICEQLSVSFPVALGSKYFYKDRALC